MNLHYFYIVYITYVFVPSFELILKNLHQPTELSWTINLIKTTLGTWNIEKLYLIYKCITHNLGEITNLQDGLLQMTCQFVQL